MNSIVTKSSLVLLQGLSRSCLVLLQIITQNGYLFVTHKTTLQDQLYKTEDNFYKNSGITWLYKWAITHGNLKIFSRKSGLPWFHSETGKYWFGVRFILTVSSSWLFRQSEISVPKSDITIRITEPIFSLFCTTKIIPEIWSLTILYHRYLMPPA